MADSRTGPAVQKLVEAVQEDRPRRADGCFRSRAPSERFWPKVRRRSPHECWEWQAATANHGYGAFFDGRRMVLAHRFSYELHHGSIPEGMFVCHTCDSPTCVNPAHLFAAPHAENMADMVRKGRAQAAEAHHAAMLTADDVLAIRRFCAAGRRQVDVAAEFGVSRTTVCRIVNRRTWRHTQRRRPNG